MQRTILNLFEFSKSALAVNLALSLAAALFGGMALFTSVFLSFGFIASIAMKEVNHKNYYLFYYDNGFSKAKLWFYCYLINAFFLFLFFVVYNFILKHFG